MTFRHKQKNNAVENQVQNAEHPSQYRLIKYRPQLNYLLRSRCRFAFVVISLLAMLVVIRSGISASRGYALVATQNQTQQLEQVKSKLQS